MNFAPELTKYHLVYVVLLNESYMKEGDLFV